MGAANVQWNREYLDQLITRIDDFRKKREALNDSIRDEENEKIEIQEKLPKLTVEVSRATDSIARLTQTKEEVEDTHKELSQNQSTIQKEAANYKKILLKRDQYKTEDSGSMPDATSTLDRYNDELVTCVEELTAKKQEIEEKIAEESATQTAAQSSLRSETMKLSKMNDSLNRKVAARNEYDINIQETEAAYLKILEISLDHHHR